MGMDALDLQIPKMAVGFWLDEGISSKKKIN